MKSLAKIINLIKLGPAQTKVIISNKVMKMMGKLPNVPHVVHIELTNACNLECIMCDRESLSRQHRSIKMDTFKYIIDDLASIKVPCVKLNRFGEPLLHPKLTEMIRYAKSQNIYKVFFTTNATLLTEEKAEDIIKSGLDSIDFSIDGGTKETYEKIRKGAKFEEVVNNIVRFKKIRDRLGSSTPRMCLHTLLMNETKDEMKLVFDRWSDIVDEIHIMPVAQYGNMEDHGFIDPSEVDGALGPCTSLANPLLVFWDGTVTLCCADINGELAIGNILEESMSKIWKNKKMQRVLELHQRKDFSMLPICTNCDGTKESLNKEKERVRQEIYGQYGRH